MLTLDFVYLALGAFAIVASLSLTFITFVVMLSVLIEWLRKKGQNEYIPPSFQYPSHRSYRSDRRLLHLCRDTGGAARAS